MDIQLFGLQYIFFDSNINIFHTYLLQGYYNENIIIYE